MLSDPAIPLPRYFTKRNEIRCPHKLVHKCSLHFSSQQPKMRNNPNVHQLVNGYADRVLAYSGILCSTKKERTSDVQPVSANPESITISERTKAQKTIYSRSIHMNSRKDKIYTGQNQIRERGVPAKGHTGILWNDENVLGLEFGGDCSVYIYTDICIYQSQ